MEKKMEENKSSSNISLVKLMIAASILGILAALLIPTSYSYVTMSDIKEKKYLIYEKIDEYERNISQKDYSELVEKITIEFLENIKSELRNLPPPKSKSEIEFQKRLIEKRISQLSSLDEAVRSSSEYRDLDRSENLELRIAQLELKLDLLSQDRVTKYDVVAIDFIFLSAVAAIIGIFKFLYENKIPKARKRFNR
jgi:Tfp pilus assembly protein PilE